MLADHKMKQISICIQKIVKDLKLVERILNSGSHGTNLDDLYTFGKKESQDLPLFRLCF